MNFMLLILEPHGQRAERSPEQGEAAYAQMQRFAGDLQARGVLRGVESLQSDARGKRVQVRAGQARLLDGPFSESKEMIGGFFLVDCATLDDAVAIASQCPAAGWATVEVRAAGPCFL